MAKSRPKKNFSISSIAPLIGLFFFIFWIPRFFLIYVQNRALISDFSFFAAAKFIVFDIAALAYLLLPLSFILLIVYFFPKNRFLQIFAKGIIYFSAFTLLVLVTSEIFFIEEFFSRFNFIAVDYLVYTNEVIRNIWESFPIAWIIGGLAILALPCFIWGFRPFFEQIQESRRFALTASFFVFTFSGLSCLWVDEGKMLSPNGSFSEELAKNSLHTLFSAYRHNEIDFFRFYQSANPQESTRFVHKDINALETSQAAPNAIVDDTLITRNIQFAKKSKRLNVVLVLMESMSAKFLGVYGYPKNITPNLDRIAKEGIWFDQLYATGTRTVRGIEAVLLSIPPTPGQSIVRRDKGIGIFQLGSVLQDAGYSLSFIYGGHSFFDNMRAFFAGNHFSIYDQGTFDPKEINFANAWGVSDEDLLEEVEKIASKDAKNGKPFFHFVLTTSNHRPFTFPDGRIDLPSHSGRDGAVKFADYSIGKFLKDSAKHSWFDDTIFIFAADHNASVAGGTNVLPDDYLIPVFFYAPKHLKPERKSGIASQIDIAPTILSTLRLPYQSRFWGVNLLDKRPGRAFFGTYQKVGMYDGKQMALLSPKKSLELFSTDSPLPKLLYRGTEWPEEAPPLLSKTLHYYTAASYWYTNNLLSASLRAPAEANLRIE